MNPIDHPLLYSLSKEQAEAATVYGEDRNHGLDGMTAVACVIRNREELWKQDFQAVCFGKDQFSCWLSSGAEYPTMIALAHVLSAGGQGDNIYQQCVQAVRGAQSGSCGKIRPTFYRVIGTVNPWYDRQVANGTFVKVATLGHTEFHMEKRFM